MKQNESIHYEVQRIEINNKSQLEIKGIIQEFINKGWKQLPDLNIEGELYIGFTWDLSPDNPVYPLEYSKKLD